MMHPGSIFSARRIYDHAPTVGEVIVTMEPNGSTFTQQLTADEVVTTLKIFGVSRIIELIDQSVWFMYDEDGPYITGPRRLGDMHLV